MDIDIESEWANKTYLVKIVRLEDGRRHDTSTGSGLDHDIDAAEEDVLASADGGSLGGGADGEDSAVAVVAEAGAGQRVEGAARALGEVTVAAVFAKGRVGRAA